MPAAAVNPIIGSLPRVEDSMAKQVTALVSKDSALNQMARTEGLKAANRRGLLNSSMAVEASQDAVLKNIIPIAGQDAATAAAKNQAASAFEYGMAGQEQQQGWQTGERLGTQAWQTAEGQAGRSWQTGERLGTQEFAGTQADLDRLLQRNMQTQQLDAATANQIRQIASTEGLEAANRALQTALQASAQAFQRGERIDTQAFAADQADLDRILQQAMQTRQLDTATAQQIRQIASTEGLEAANRELQTALQASAQAWGTGERLGTQQYAADQADLDRILSRGLQTQQLDESRAAQIRQIGSTEGIEAANRELQAALQESAQAFESSEAEVERRWQTGENVAARGWQTAENIQQRGFISTQAQLDRALEQTMQKAQITADDVALVKELANRTSIETAKNKLTELLTTREIDARMKEGNLDRASAEKIVNLEIAAAKADRTAVTASQERIAKMNLSATDRDSAARMVGNVENSYQTMYNTIMNNTKLSATQRTNQLTAARSLRDKDLGLVEQLFNVNLKW
jgi:hypothetical protein